MRERRKNKTNSPHACKRQDLSTRVRWWRQRSFENQAYYIYQNRCDFSPRGPFKGGIYYFWHFSQIGQESSIVFFPATYEASFSAGHYSALFRTLIDHSWLMQRGIFLHSVFLPLFRLLHQIWAEHVRHIHKTGYTSSKAWILLMLTPFRT